MKILYAGDSKAGGPANYLLAILRSIGALCKHVPPSIQLKPSDLRRPFDAIILSDYSKKQVSSACEKLIARQVENGTGLLMVGGWGSFSGPLGGWRGSLIEKLLPVGCLSRDDRLQFPGGAAMELKTAHPMLKGVSFQHPPVICGFNEVHVKRDAHVLLAARKIMNVRDRLFLDTIEHPLLIVSANSAKRAAAFTTDFAPHWCGGLVDWGDRRVKLPVQKNIAVEVGDRYLEFVSSILRWISGI